MGISAKTRKRLWANSGNMCAFEGCFKELTGHSLDGSSYVIGEECHIVARSQNGPRGDQDLSSGDIDNYDNLILMCSEHHKLIDDNPELYTVEKLKEMKKNHENYILNLKKRSSLNNDNIIENVLFLIEKWCKLVNIDNWEGWTSFMLSNGHPRIHVKQLDNLHEANKLICGMILPDFYIDLKNAFDNFMHVSSDLITLFREYCYESNGLYITERFYRTNPYDEYLYESLLEKFNFHVNLVQDLVLELTRAANFICDKVREYIDPNFRLKEGILSVVTGPEYDLSYTTLYPQYFIDTNSKVDLYKNLDTFKIERLSRDFYFGVDKENNF